MALLNEIGLPATMAMAGPRFFGFVIGGVLPAILAANWLAAACDQNTGLHEVTPGTATSERNLEFADLPHGAFGENFTLSGVAEPDVCIGDIYQVGSWRLEITQPRQPCWKLARRWRIRDLAARVQETGYTGWYFRIRNEGSVEAGQPLILLERPNRAGAIARANEVVHKGSARPGGRTRAGCLPGAFAELARDVHAAFTGWPEPGSSIPAAAHCSDLPGG